jgi:hypothetical protein
MYAYGHYCTFESMSRVLLCTVSDDRFGRKEGLYQVTQDKVESVFKNNPSFGITHFLSMKWDDIERSAFYKSNKALLSDPDASRNGRAYKPYAIWEGLKQIDHGDFLIYSDCSPEMWNKQNNDEYFSGRNLQTLKDLCTSNNGILSAFVKWDTRLIPTGGLGIHTHENFTTDRCMRVMGLEKYSRSFMHASGMFVIQKQNHTCEFVRDWLHFNCIDECASLGRIDVPGDYSYWDHMEEFTKMGHRHDQSISGLLINALGNKLVDIVYSSLHSYNFLNWCDPDHNYSFIDSNHNPETERRFKKGINNVKNSAGTILSIFEFRPENGIEWIIVGQHRESCYRTTADKLTPII